MAFKTQTVVKGFQTVGTIDSYYDAMDPMDTTGDSDDEEVYAVPVEIVKSINPNYPDEHFVMLGDGCLLRLSDLDTMITELKVKSTTDLI
jgi:hypothetical protein